MSEVRNHRAQQGRRITRQLILLQRSATISATNVRRDYVTNPRLKKKPAIDVKSSASLKISRVIPTSMPVVAASYNNIILRATATLLTPCSKSQLAANTKQNANTDKPGARPKPRRCSPLPNSTPDTHSTYNVGQEVPPPIPGAFLCTERLPKFRQEPPDNFQPETINSLDFGTGGY